MNTLNSSTGFSPFILKTGRSPQLTPPFIPSPATDAEIKNDDAAARALAAEFINNMEALTLAVKDNLLASKITQAHFTNRNCNGEPQYSTGDKVLLATAHRRREFMQAKDGHVAKFMPRYDGPYEIIQAFPEDSTYRLQLPLTSKVHPNFHVSQLRPFLMNDDKNYPDRKHTTPGPIVTTDGSTEYFIEKLLDC